MKRILAVIVSCLIVGSLSAQTVNRTGDQNYMGQLSVGTGTTTYTPTDPSAALQVGLPGTTKGLLLPRVTDTSSVTAPAFGLQVFSLADSTIYFYSNKWVGMTDYRTGNFIKNQQVSKQDANSWYVKSIIDTVTNHNNPSWPIDFNIGTGQFNFDGKTFGLDYVGNTFIGKYAAASANILNSVSIGNSNMTDAIGNANTSIGYEGLFSTNGSNNTSVGVLAGRDLDSSNNSLFGYNSGVGSYGQNLTFIGSGSRSISYKVTQFIHNDEYTSYDSTGLAIRGLDVDTLISKSGMSVGQRGACNIVFYPPYPTFKGQPVQNISGKIVVGSSDSIKILPSSFFDDVGSGGSTLYLANFIDNSTALGYGSLIDSSHQVVLGDSLTTQQKWGGLGNVRWATNIKPVNSQVPVWDSNSGQFKPQTLKYDSLGWFVVTSYGAKGDSSTDDTKAIQAAFNAVPSDGGVVYFPRGIYIISDTILVPNRCTVLGDGQQIIRLDSPSVDAYSGSLVIQNTANKSAFVVNSGGVAFDGMGIKQNNDNSTSGSGISVSNANQMYITRTSINNFYINLDIIAGFYWQISNSFFQDGVLNNISISDTTYPDGGDAIISNSYFNVGKYSGSTQIYQVSGGGLKINGCKFQRTNGTLFPPYRMLDLSMAQGTSILIVSNSSFEDFYNNAIRINADPPATFQHILINNNEFAPVNNNAQHLIDVQTNTLGYITQINISNNTFSNRNDSLSVLYLKNCELGNISGNEYFTHSLKNDSLVNCYQFVNPVSGTVKVNSNNISEIPLDIYAPSTQTTDLTDWTVGGVLKARIDKSGNGFFPSIFSSTIFATAYQANDNSFQLSGTALSTKSSFAIRFTNGNSYSGTYDLGLGRNAPNVLEINKGTPGNYADLLLRNLTASGTLSVTGKSFLGTTPPGTSSDSTLTKGSDGTVHATAQFVSLSDSASVSGDGSATSFTVSVSPGWTPTKVFITPTTADAAKATLYVSAITSTSFTVSVAGTTPPSGTNNVRFFYQLVK